MQHDIYCWSMYVVTSTATLKSPKLINNGRKRIERRETRGEMLALRCSAMESRSFSRTREKEFLWSFGNLAEHAHTCGMSISPRQPILIASMRVLASKSREIKAGADTPLLKRKQGFKILLPKNPLPIPLASRKNDHRGNLFSTKWQKEH